MSNPFSLSLLFNRELDEEIVRGTLNSFIENNLHFFVFETKEETTERESEYCEYFSYDRELEGSKKIKISDFISEIAKSSIGGVTYMKGNSISCIDLSFHKNHKVIDITYPYSSINYDEMVIFLNIGINLCKQIRPVYAMGEFEIGKPNIDCNIHSFKINHVYYLNFFSPELVKKIGREKLLSAPSWKTEELKDGGILLILGATPYELEVEREEVEKHLGFK